MHYDSISDFRMSSEGDDGGPPPKRNKRGPYKTYLFDPTKSVPRTTLLSRNRTACKLEISYITFSAI